MREQISAIAGVIGGCVAYLVGGFDSLLSVFAVILILDTAAGMIKALKNGQYESKKFRSGIVNKLSYIIGIILAVQIDILMGGTGILRDSIITFFVANEAMSIIENLGEMGVVFPQIVQNAIKSLKDKSDINSEEK